MTEASGVTRVGGSLGRLWQVVRVPGAVGLAVAAIMWLAIEALSPDHVGPIALVPFIVMALLIYPVPALAAALPKRRQRLVGLVVAVIAAVVMVRGLSFPDVSWSDTRWLGDAATGLILRGDGLAMPVWVPILLTAVMVWVRGQMDDSLDGVRDTFRFGAIALLVVALGAAFGGMASEGRIGTAAILFFATILLALNWARQAEVHPGERSGGGLVPSLSGLASVGGVILLAVVLAAIASPGAFDTLIWLLTPVIWAVRTAIFGIGIVVLVVLYPIFWVLERLLDGRTEMPSPPTQTIVGASPVPIPEEVASTGVSVPDELRIVLAALILGGILLLFARQVLRRVVLTAPTDVEQHMEMDLRSLLRRRRRSRAEPEPDPLAALRGDPHYRDTVVIRETYAEFLRAAAGAGLPRRRPETARHHARRVATVIGSPAADVDTLTIGYGPARYRHPPATPQQRTAVIAAWERVAPGLARLAGTSTSG